MDTYRYIPLSPHRERLLYLPIILVSEKELRRRRRSLAYIPLFPTDPDANLDPEPIVSEDA